MASSEEMQYDACSVRKFQEYFLQPAKKRGRPKKKKRGRPKKMSPEECAALEKQTMMQQQEPGEVIDLTVKQREQLDARLEGTIRDLHLPVKKKAHINWDSPKYFELRKRFADSWTDKNDLYKEGECFGKFVKRCGIDRNVLRRYMKGKYKSDREIARGRKTLLPVHVMRHLIEGLYLQSQCIPMATTLTLCCVVMCSY